MIFLIITILLSLVYFYYLFLFFFHIRKGEAKHISYAKSTVSIVIAARNEEKSIANLLTVLINQSYPAELYEIIIADDGSTDATKSIVKQFTEKYSFVRLVEVINREMVQSPKKNALEQAIKNSRYEIILSTDADCLPGKYWVESMVANFTEKMDMVVGFSKTNISWRKATLVQKFEHIDFLFLFFAAAGAITAGKIFSCSGQNIAYRKKAFEKINGFASIRHLLSGDDVNLMQLFRKAGFGVGFSFTPFSFVVTQATTSWGAFMNQRIRWASNTKWQISLNPEFFLYLTSVFCTVIFPFVLLFFHLKLAVFILAVRMIFEVVFILRAGKLFRIPPETFKFYPFWFFIQPFYIILVAILGQLELFRWK